MYALMEKHLEGQNTPPLLQRQEFEGVSEQNIAQSALKQSKEKTGFIIYALISYAKIKLSDMSIRFI